jgi:hypothetical protein
VSHAGSYLCIRIGGAAGKPKVGDRTFGATRRGWKINIINIQIKLMTTKVQFLITISLSLLLALLTSCNKDNVDEVISDDDFPIDTIICTLSYQLIFDDATASISVTNLTGGTAPYSYSWSTGESSAVIMVSTSGSYSVTVTDADGCPGVDSIQVDLNPCDSTFTVNIQQQGFDSLLTAMPSGGSTPYSYLWSTGVMSSAIMPTGLNVYSVTVTDAEGCTATDSFTVTLVDPCEDFMVTIYFHPDSMGLGIDYLNAIPSNGTFPYAFVWNSTDSLQVIDVTGSTGIFSVTVTDANGCTDEDSYVL